MINKYKNKYVLKVLTLLTSVLPQMHRQLSNDAKMNLSNEWQMKVMHPQEWFSAISKRINLFFLKRINNKNI